MKIKSFLVFAALVGLVGVLLFGVRLIAHPNTMGSHANCLPTLTGTSECKTNTNPFEYVRIHLGVFTAMITAIPSSVALAMFSALIVFLCAVTISKSYNSLSASQRQYSLAEENAPRGVLGRLLRWTSLHEKRGLPFVFTTST
ncbi:MAG: hypothetical protein AAB631_03005 [Patescibacteria group bacterium]